MTRAALPLVVLALATSACRGRDDECDALAFEATQLVEAGRGCAEDADCHAVATTDEGAAGDYCGALATFVGQGCAVGVGRAFREERFVALRRDSFARGCRRLTVTDCGAPSTAHCERAEGAASGTCVADPPGGCGATEPADAGEPADASDPSGA